MTEKVIAVNRYSQRWAAANHIFERYTWEVMSGRGRVTGSDEPKWGAELWYGDTLVAAFEFPGASEFNWITYDQAEWAKRKLRSVRSEINRLKRERRLRAEGQRSHNGYVVRFTTEAGRKKGKIRSQIIRSARTPEAARNAVRRNVGNGFGLKFVSVRKAK